MGGFFLMSLMPLLFAIGFAYIIWVLASKEGVALKTVGQVIAVAIVVIALLSSAFVGGRGYRGKSGFGQGRLFQSSGGCVSSAAARIPFCM